MLSVNTRSRKSKAVIIGVLSTENPGAFHNPAKEYNEYFKNALDHAGEDITLPLLLSAFVSFPMNLELLDPFRRQVPDRIDSTLQTQNSMHKPLTQKEMNDDPEYKAAYHLSFNRRGTYLAVGYATGSIVVHDFLSRTTSAVYTTDTNNEVYVHHPELENVTRDSVTKTPTFTYPNGATSVTWSRRSRTIAVGSVGDSTVRLIDSTHPFGPETASILLGAESKKEEDTVMPKQDKKLKEDKTDQISGVTEVTKSFFLKVDPHPLHYQRLPRYLNTDRDIATAQSYPSIPSLIPIEEHIQEIRKQNEQKMDSQKRIPLRFPILVFQLPDLLSGSLQVHPKDTTAGLAILQDGSIVLFRAPQTAWELHEDIDCPSSVRIASLCKAGKGNATKFTCAAWSHTGDKIVASTKSGDLLAFDVVDFMIFLGSTAKCVPDVKPIFRLNMGAMAWHLTVSRNGKYLLLNCADGALRLYPTEDLFANKLEELKPKTFQDVVSKEPFVCCDFSGDAEYLVGGCNGQNEKYELYLWNTSSGALMDRLTGAQVQLYSVAWHPTRSFLAVATSDGLVDIWGPRMDWTAFAPDFQALPMNVEYVEREDEFDLVDEHENDVEEKEMEEIVDVVTVDAVPVFASDSESESEVFAFETKIQQGMAPNRGRPPWKSDKATNSDE